MILQTKSKVHNGTEMQNKIQKDNINPHTEHATLYHRA